MTDFTSLTSEELEQKYRSAMSDYRFYTNTDDYSNYVRETKERDGARSLLDNLTDEYKRRGLTPPRIP